MKEKTKNILRIVLTVLDTILHLFIKKQDTPCQHPDHSHLDTDSHPEPKVDARRGQSQTCDCHPELVSGSEKEEK